MWQVVIIVTGALVGYLLLKLIQLYRADADFQVLGSTMKPEYFKDRVVWVTGASSGSKLKSNHHSAMLMDSTFQVPRETRTS